MAVYHLARELLETRRQALVAAILFGALLMVSGSPVSAAEPLEFRQQRLKNNSQEQPAKQPASGCYLRSMVAETEGFRGQGQPRWL